MLMFRLTIKEADALRSQFVISRSDLRSQFANSESQVKWVHMIQISNCKGLHASGVQL